MGSKTKYNVRYRGASGGYVTEMVDAQSESDAIQMIRKRQPKASEVVATLHGATGRRTKYNVRYRGSSGGYVTEMLEAQSESDAIQMIRKRQPKATEIVATLR